MPSYTDFAAGLLNEPYSPPFITQVTWLKSEDYRETLFSVSFNLPHHGLVFFPLSELALEPPNSTVRASLQSTLYSESIQLHTVYNKALYGGPALEGSLADESNDKDDGGLFKSKASRDS